MTDNELHDAIAANPAAKALADAGDDAGCARLMADALPPTLVPCYLNERGIFATFVDPADAEAVMQGLEAAAGSESPLAPILKRAIVWLRPTNGGIDMGNPSTRVVLDALQAAGALTPEAVATLKATAETPAIVTADQVSAAWSRHRPEGKVQA